MKGSRRNWWKKQRNNLCRKVNVNWQNLEAHLHKGFKVMATLKKVQNYGKPRPQKEGRIWPYNQGRTQ